MPPTQILSFDTALTLAPEQKKRHLLLGNGFSRAWQDDIFSYDALLEQARFDDLSPFARHAFDSLRTTDFEDVMRALHSAATLISLYEETNRELPRRLLEDAAGLKEVMVQAIAGRHPDRPHAVTEEEYQHARVFLANFQDIYTLNYDLLLYWTLMQRELDPHIRFDDGFRTPDGGDSDYVTWEVEKTDRQNVFYIHGALHIFDGGHEIKKYTWNNTGVPLLEQIRSALDGNLFPLFVAEGESDHKLDKIRHSDFLARSYRSFAKIGGALFVYGHSMGGSDEHVLRLIEKNRCSQLFISLYGQADSPSNREIIARSHAIATARPTNRPLEVRFFDAASAKVWRE